MKRKLSIQKIYSKGPGKMNEDELLIGKDIYGVFDGVTSLVDFKGQKGKTGGKIAAETVKKLFSKNKRSLRKLALLANREMFLKTKRLGADVKQKESLFGTTAAVVRLKKNFGEFFQIADSLILVIHQNGKYSLPIKYYDHDLELMMLWKKLADKKVRNIKTKLKFQAINLRKESNITYGVLNGEKGAKKFFKFGKINLRDIKSIILFTNGLLIPKKNPKGAENWPLFVKIYQKDGLEGLLKHVRFIEQSDPNCWRYPRFKQSDDIAAIGIDFS